MPSLSTKMHFLKHTEIYVPSEMIAYAPQDIFQTLPVPVQLGYVEGLKKKCNTVSQPSPVSKKKKDVPSTSFFIFAPNA